MKSRDKKERMRQTEKKGKETDPQGEANKPNKKSHQDFHFCQKILGVRMCCVRP